MHTAARCGWLRPFANFALILTITSSFSLAAFGQDGGAEEKKTAEQEIQELVADLETRRVELEELTRKVSKSPDRAAAVAMEKELSDRRERSRRDVKHLVELVVAGEDAGAATAQGRDAAAKLLEADERAMRQRMEELDRRVLELLDTAAESRRRAGHCLEHCTGSDSVATGQLNLYLRSKTLLEAELCRTVVPPLIEGLSKTKVCFGGEGACLESELFGGEPLA